MSEESSDWSPPEGWEAVIGLEVHAQLATKSKLFSSAPNAFGGEPNTHTTEVDLGLPGVLPVLNERAVQLAVRTALALDCEIQPVSLFARKHYFYPDLPKGYQISQFEEPFALGGSVPVLSSTNSSSASEGELLRVPLTRIHMEEDAAKSTHEAQSAGQKESHVNLNRAGTPLIEIVSDPALHSPAQAAAYFRSLRGVLRYLGVSDGDMEKGQLRCDANVSVRRVGDERLGTRVELKNLNSFRFLERSLEYEIERQVEALEEGGKIVQETRLWDERAGQSRPMRSKEYADDYRYFPDPDLVALRLVPEWVERLRGELPELPHERRIRYTETLGLPVADAQILVEERELAEFYEAALEHYGDARKLANWVVQSVLGLIAQHGSLAQLKLRPEHLGRLLERVDAGSLTPANAREVLEEVATSGADPDDVVRERGLEALSDRDELEALVRATVEASPENVAQYRAGEAKVFNWFVGQVMRRTQGKGNPALVRELLERVLEA